MPTSSNYPIGKVNKAFIPKVFVYWLAIFSEIVLGLFLFIIDPGYFSQLIVPGENQPLGRLVILVLLLLLFAQIIWAIQITRKIKNQSYSGGLLQVIFFVLLTCVVFFIILTAPTVVILLASPVGSLFLGM